MSNVCLNLQRYITLKPPLKLSIRFQRYSHISDTQNNKIQRELNGCISKSIIASSDSFFLITSQMRQTRPCRSGSQCPVSRTYFHSCQTGEVCFTSMEMRKMLSHMFPYLLILFHQYFNTFFPLSHSVEFNYAVCQVMQCYPYRLQSRS